MLILKNMLTLRFRLITLLTILLLASPALSWSALASGTEASAGTALILSTNPSEDDFVRANAASALREAGIGIIALETAEMAGFDKKHILDCFQNNGECADYLQSASSDWVLVLHILQDEKKQDADKTIVVKLYGTQDGSLLQIEQRVCQRCSSSERLAKLISALVLEVAQAELAHKASDTYLQVHSTPAHGILSIDGVVIGPTGQSYRVSPGEHTIQIQHKGFRTKTQVVHISANQSKTVQINLLKEGENSSPQNIRKWIAYPSLGVGVALLGLGAYWISVDGNRADNSSVLDTRTPGITSMVAGSVLVGAGVFLLMTQSDKEEEEEEEEEGLQISAAPGPNGFSIGLSGHF